MSLAIAYAMKRKKKCHGGDMAKGGDVKGVHPASQQAHRKGDNGGTSYAGQAYRDSKTHGGKGRMDHAQREEFSHLAKEEHRAVLDEMHGMKHKDRKYMAEGGYCDEGCEMLHEHKYAEGGEVEKHPEHDHEKMKRIKESLAKVNHTMMNVRKQHGAYDKPKKLAEGGFVDEEEASGFDPMVEEGEDDLVGRIMKKRCYSEGGKVSNDDMPEADFKEAEYDDLPLDDDLAFHYTGKNSGDECGDEAVEEEDRDVVSRIMKSRKKKDRMPSPA